MLDTGISKTKKITPEFSRDMPELMRGMKLQHVAAYNESSPNRSKECARVQLGTSRIKPYSSY